MTWLGVDLGTQGVRALAVSEGGAVVGRGSAPLVSRRVGDRHEQEPEQWWEAFGRACRAATEAAKPARIEAVAVCATSGTVMLVDGAGDPLSPGLMYDDGRAGGEAARIAALGEGFAYRIPASWGLPKLLWLLEHDSGHVRGARLAHQADFVTRRLVGHAVPTDSSQALKSGYDLVGECWPEAAMDALGIRAGVLPEVVRPGTQLGEVGAAGAQATGIPLGTPVLAGMTDGCAGQLATGALEVGDWSSTLGTTLILKGVSDAPVRDPGGALYCHRSPDGRWLPGGASSVGGGVLQARFAGRDLAALDRRAAGREPAGVLAYPLVGRGERFPFVVPEAQGFVLGEPADGADLYAALLQGVAYVERLCFDYLDHLGAPVDGSLTATGGATRSRYWSQLRADVLGRPLRLVEHPEPAFGMAVLAAVGAAGGPAAAGGARRAGGQTAAGGARGGGGQAAAGGEPGAARNLTATAAAMARVSEVIAPRAERIQTFCAPYLRLVDELERRGWLEATVAAHARARAGA